MANTTIQLFEVKEISGKGRGLVANLDIMPGTRILCEKPLLTTPNMTQIDIMESFIALKLKTLSATEQRQFLTLHNNFPGKHPFSGIVKTNALPCGPDSMVGGIYPTICLINHDCVPNTSNCWNPEKECETIHTTRLVKAGEEVTISYVGDATFETRRRKLKDNFNFTCTCELCSLSPLEHLLNDDRRLEIDRLDNVICNPTRVMLKPEDCLADCHQLLDLLEEVYKGGAEALKARVYYDAFHICSLHGDSARAGVLAARGHESRLLCEGEDSPDMRNAKNLKNDPTRFAGFGKSSMWKTEKKAVPKGVDRKAFEKWLWREK